MAAAFPRPRHMMGAPPWQARPAGGYGPAAGVGPRSLPHASAASGYQLRQELGQPYQPRPARAPLRGSAAFEDAPAWSQPSAAGGYARITAAKARPPVRGPFNLPLRPSLVPADAEEASGGGGATSSTQAASAKPKGPEVGIGAKFRKGGQGFFKCIGMQPGSVAEAQGLRVDDQLLQANGKSMLNMTFVDLSLELLGAPGSELKLIVCHSDTGSIPRQLVIRRPGADPEPAVKEEDGRANPGASSSSPSIPEPKDFSNEELRSNLKALGTAKALGDKTTVPKLAKQLMAGFLTKLGVSTVFEKIFEIFSRAQVAHRKALTYVVHVFLQKVKGSSVVSDAQRQQWQSAALEAFLMKIGQQVRQMPVQERQPYCRLVTTWGEKAFLQPEDIQRLKAAWEIID
eukprot:TRINITY_DN74845_c0_g1_i1.p1 TRINITY_DN74845_c0_g1~~TRINITY_DN74845_c0_g1_i1.p1  ORF type:complete len:401 (-),score=88.84 TRINITY_DN74845_c0_g1_i1:44-1246(-)